MAAARAECYDHGSSTFFSTTGALLLPATAPPTRLANAIHTPSEVC